MNATNPLHTHFKSKYPEIDSDRASGRSTIIALETIAKAIRNPGVKIRVIDHHDTYDADFHLFRMIESYLSLLQFQHFIFTIGPNKIYFIQFGE